MNTYRIYEDLRSSLGEEAAKSLAHTLGPMFEELGDTVTKADFRELNATVGRLAEAQSRTEVQVATLTQVIKSLGLEMNRQGTRLDAVLGWTFEMRFRDRLTSYLGRLMRRGRLMRNDEVLDAVERSIAPEEADELLRADAIATGLIDGVASHVVVEVSATCAADDIDRAEGRAGILRKAGLSAVPLVACEAIARELIAYAQSRQVRVWCNGTMLDATAA